VTLRLAAALALAIGVIGLAGFFAVVGEGPFVTPEERHLRAMKERTGTPERVEPVGYEFFAALPHDRPLPEFAALERRAVSLEGYVQQVVPASDGDVHLEVARRPPGDPAYDPRYVTAEITPAWRRGSRPWRIESLLATFRPTHGGPTPWDGGPRRVRVSGWLLYDFQYDGPPTARRPRLTGWEIHPVTRVEVWDEARMAFVEVAR
jgi:hypothetical protein